jgi:tetratricopeptide (TPR) repeat protein
MSAQEAAERLRDAIARGYDDLQAYAKKSFSQNATLVLGMAHAHRRLGQHDEAVTFYRQVINGLSPEASRNMYGEAQLGYVQSLFEINRDNAQQLEHLDEHIERLREIAPNFWNRERFLPRFNRIQAQIRNRLREID